MQTLAAHDQALARAFKAAVIRFLTAWLIPRKWACKIGTSQGIARIFAVPNSR
jgi:hypothetical protein